VDNSGSSNQGMAFYSVVVGCSQEIRAAVNGSASRALCAACKAWCCRVGNGCKQMLLSAALLLAPSVVWVVVVLQAAQWPRAHRTVMLSNV
jgi:hypothetical protein